MESNVDALTGLDSQVGDLSKQAERLRQYFVALSVKLIDICERTDSYFSGDTIRLDDGEDDWCFGHLYCDRSGLRLAHAYSGDSLNLEPGESVSYSLMEIEKWPISWLSAISNRTVIEGFLEKVNAKLADITTSLIKKMDEVEAVVSPPTKQATDDLSKIAKALGFNDVVADWRKAQLKITTEPEGAVRMSCVLIESVCKHILDDHQTSYDPKADLPALYKVVRTALNLDPAGQATPIRNLCSGLITSIENIGSFRNTASDAHGKGSERIPVDQSLAAFVVNSGGTISAFLLKTWQTKKERK